MPWWRSDAIVILRPAKITMTRRNKNASCVLKYSCMRKIYVFTFNLTSVPKLSSDHAKGAKSE